MVTGVTDSKPCVPRNNRGTWSLFSVGEERNAVLGTTSLLLPFWQAGGKAVAVATTGLLHHLSLSLDVPGSQTDSFKDVESLAGPSPHIQPVSPPGAAGKDPNGCEIVGKDLTHCLSLPGKLSDALLHLRIISQLSHCPQCSRTINLRGQFQIKVIKEEADVLSELRHVLVSAFPMPSEAT